MNKLKPCPFCGKQPELNDHKRVNDMYQIKTEYSIGCYNNKCVCWPCTRTFKIEQEVIDAWNKRS